MSLRYSVFHGSYPSSTRSFRTSDLNAYRSRRLSSLSSALNIVRTPIRPLPRRPSRVRGYAARASRTLRRMVRRRLNRRTRNRRRVRRARRALRRHRSNPYTRHRLMSTRRFRRSIRRFGGRRSLRRFRLPLRRINPWYSIGKWWLFGSYLGASENQLSVLDGLTAYFSSETDHYGASANPSVTLPYAVNSATTPTVAYYNSSVAFNATVSATSATPSFVINPYVPDPSSSILPGVFASVADFYYANTSTETQRTPTAVMPPVPSQVIQYSGDTSNPQGVSYSAGTQYVQYRCYWPCCYCRMSYAMKARWPESWTALKGADTNSANNVLPDNPPLYVRLIGVRYRAGNGSGLPLSAAALPPLLFPTASPINAPLTRTGRSNLFRSSSGLVFFDKLWMFNGRITPQFQQGEVLEDGEESSFTVKVPMGYTNRPQTTGNQGINDAYWPGAFQTPFIRWYLFAQFKTPFFRYPSDVELQPQFSVKMAPSYYCYPRLSAPRYLSPFAGTGLQSYNPTVRALATGPVGNSVATASLDAVPVLESQGSSSAGSSSILSSTSSE